MNSYLLATCTFTPLYGRLCNVMGRRGANQTAVFFAALGTLACGLSPNMEVLIAARFVGRLSSTSYHLFAQNHVTARWYRWRWYIYHSYVSLFGLGLTVDPDGTTHLQSHYKRHV